MPLMAEGRTSGEGASPLLLEGRAVVIVPFVRWGDLARRCVDGCLALDDEDFLVCLVPSGQGEVPEPWLSHPGVEIIVSRVHGISAKRNLAIRAHPEAELFACIDSDAWPEPLSTSPAEPVPAKRRDVQAGMKRG